jgi:NAD(P)-dependent dehydrogenase (short-subunit alcohol dehydrogenase family)
MNDDSLALSGRHALVTGAGGGIGAAITKVLARHGARVTLLGRNRQSLDALAASVKSAETHIVQADVASHADVTSSFAAARSVFGPISILVNNAGQAASAPLHRTDDALWRTMLDVNLTGTFYCTREALPDMLSAGFGRIVNIASIAGLTGAPYIGAYCASKHGVVGLTRALAREVATKDITVNAVCPGYTDTAMVQRAVDNIRTKTRVSEAEALATLTATNPQGRLVTPEEVAHTVEWLCLPGSESITGQSIALSGGGIA